MDLESLIERARDNVKTAEQRVREAPGDIEAAIETRRLYELSHSTGSLAAERRHMAELVEQKERRDAAVTDHAAAEKANAKALVAVGADLGAARKQLAAVTETAIAALVDLWDATEAYGQQLADKAAALHAADLPAVYRDGDVEVRFDTGAYPLQDAHSWPWLILAGQQWHRIHPVPVLQYARDAAVAARQYVYGPKREHPLYDTLDPVVARPEPVPAPTPAVPPQPWDLNAPVATYDGLRYQDGTVVSNPPKVRGRDGVWRYADGGAA